MTKGATTLTTRKRLNSAARLFSTAVGLVVMGTLTSSVVRAAEALPPKSVVLDCFISTGDNHWVGSWLPVDSKASIEASLDFLKRLGVRRIYWRGLEQATWVDTFLVREENCRYAAMWKWWHQIYREVDPDRTAVEAAHRLGMEIWGVATLSDWGSSADAPCSGDFPHNSESRLRIGHPEWIPVDRSGLLKQGGPIELGYPEARRALVDLHMKFMKRDGYDGLIFLTYAENYSTRFQDEFGFNDPVVQEFKRRTGLDIRTQPFNRTASRDDWYALRGEYVTQYLRELKTELAGSGKRLGLFINPAETHFPQPWNVPELILTAGHIYFDLETWVREGIVDELVAYGSSGLQLRATENLLWLTRQTKTSVSAITSSPFAERWKPFHQRGVATAIAVGEEDAYLERIDLPAQPLEALRGTDDLARLKALSQVIHGKTRATVAELAAFAKHANLLVRRMTLKALAALADPQAIAIIEAGLEDPENGGRCAAAEALRLVNRPESAAKLLAAVDRFGTHSLVEIATIALTKIQPPPRGELATAALGSKNPMVRVAAMRTFRYMATEELVPVLERGLVDPERGARFAAAEALANLTRSPRAVEVLIAATRHDDPVVSDRAATSLGAIAARRAKEVEPLRPRILEALEKLYAKLGTGCQRSDADWGYRPVGNALLKLGPEGEKVLQAFMEQRCDRRLAEFAWKSLWIRQDNGTFSEVTEKENEQAFRHRPGSQSAAAAGPSRSAAPSITASRRALDFYVDPEKGSDAADGRSPESKAGSGPFKTIAHAITTALPGDTIHLAPTTYTQECVLFRNKSGEPGRPITLDGHGAVIDGSDPLIEADWREVSPGLYRNSVLYSKTLHSSEAFVSRFGLVIRGRLNRMGRSGKGRCDPYKAVADLNSGEWTYQPADGHAFYLKIAPNETLSRYAIRVPTRVTAVQIYGNVSHIVIRNITGRHVLNDGFGLTSGSARNETGYKVRDIVFENVKAFECCDDGMSSHADSELRVDGLEVDGCATGIGNCGSDTIRRLVTRNIHGVDLYYYGGRHVLENSHVGADGNLAALTMTTQFGNARWLADPARGALHEGWDRCVLQMKNVVFNGAQVPDKRPAKVLVGDRCVLETTGATLSGLSPVVAKGGSLRLTGQPSPSDGSRPAAAKAPASWPKATLANVPYGGHQRQVLDFYKAESARPAPLVIFIHGGGWVAGDKNLHGVRMQQCLAEGISVVSINYRYCWEAQLAGVKPPIKWPLEDAARAVQFVRSKAAEWNIDKQRIAATGGSAGGCSSLWLALHDDLADPSSSDPVARESTRLWCAAATGAQTSLDPRQLKEWTPNSCYGGHAFGFMDPTKTGSRDTQFAAFLAARDQIFPWIKEYSPIELASADDPPIYLLYNDPPALGQEQKDPTHTANYGVKLQEKLRSVGVECELDYPAASEEVHPKASRYLIRKLKAPAARKN